MILLHFRDLVSSINIMVIEHWDLQSQRWLQSISGIILISNDCFDNFEKNEIYAKLWGKGKSVTKFLYPCEF